MISNLIDCMYQYMQNKSQIIIVETDFVGNIIDCNNGFLKLTEINSIPTNKNITQFFIINTINSSNANIKDSTAIELYCLLNSRIKRVLSGLLFKKESSMLYIAEQVDISDPYILERMSELNLELSNMSREINKANRDLKLKNDTITDLMLKDPLTNLHNRRYLYAEFEHLKNSYENSQIQYLTLSIFDIDHFKTFNDKYGHDIGDQILISLARIMIDSTRDTDLKIRFGGDEFIILFNNVEPKIVLERLTEIQYKFKTLVLDGVTENTEASFGVAEYRLNESFESFTKRGDNALYEAKEKGRNCIVFNP